MAHVPTPPATNGPAKPALVSTVFWNSAPDQARRKLVEDIGKALAAGAYKTPVLPEAAVEALKLVRNPLASMERIERLIQSDPPLTAKLLSLANSPMFRGSEPFQSLRAALVRLGLEQTREILGQAVLASHVFDVQQYRGWMADLAMESAGIAVAASDLADQSGTGEAYAFLAGLLHDLGMAILLHVISKNPVGLAAPEAVVREIVDEQHGHAGQLAARKMRLAEPLICAIARHHEWSATAASDEPAALVSLARRLWACSASPDSTVDPEWPELPALNLVEPQVRQVLARLMTVRPRLASAGVALQAA